MNSPASNVYFYPTICALVDRHAASAVNTLAHYVRPEGDWILTRSDLDLIDRAFAQLEAILIQKYNGQCWSKR